MSSLATLLPLWADAAPDECREVGWGRYYLAAVSVHVKASDGANACALVLGALYVAAAARHLDINTALINCGSPVAEIEVSAQTWPEHAEDLVHYTAHTTDPAEALRLVTVGALECYLRALGVDIPATP